jgi:ubiquinone/menaquinone biosynthesis C-methylase UbiE
MKRNLDSWSGEEFWIEMIENNLYPPKAIAFMQGVEELIEEDFSGKKVLDYGCGVGQVGRIVKARGGDVIGIDISDKLLEVASKYIKVKKADGENLPFEDNEFDYVMAFMVLHIMDDLDKDLSEIYRVLKPGGKFYFGIVHPNSGKWDVEKGVIYKCENDFVEERVWMFNLTDGRKFIESYTHRPWDDYEDCFLKFFKILKKIEPELPSEYFKEGKYAKNEFLLGEMVSKKI